MFVCVYWGHVWLGRVQLWGPFRALCMGVHAMFLFLYIDCIFLRAVPVSPVWPVSPGFCRLLCVVVDWPAIGLGRAPTQKTLCSFNALGGLGGCFWVLHGQDNLPWCYVFQVHGKHSEITRQRRVLQNPHWSVGTVSLRFRFPLVLLGVVLVYIMFAFIHLADYGIQSHSEWLYLSFFPPLVLHNHFKL